MNLVNRLLESDAGKADELKEKKILSGRLGELLGEDGPVEITVREVPARRLNELLAKQYNNKGVYDPIRGFNAKAVTVGEAVSSPDLKNEELQKHFGCRNSRELAEKLFAGEVITIADVVVELSGMMGIEETDSEIKN